MPSARKASTVRLRTGEAIVSQERLVIKSLSEFYPGARPANLTSAAITDASRGVAVNATKDFTDALTRIIPKNAGETAAIQELRVAAQKTRHRRTGSTKHIPASNQNTGTHADDLLTHGNAPGKKLRACRCS